MRTVAKAITVLEKGLARIEKRLEGAKALMQERDTIRATITQLRPLIKDLPGPSLRKGKANAASRKG